jgi:hypothetical protein
VLVVLQREHEDLVQYCVQVVGTSTSFKVRNSVLISIAHKEVLSLRHVVEVRPEKTNKRVSI